MRLRMFWLCLLAFAACGDDGTIDADAGLGDSSVAVDASAPRDSGVESDGGIASDGGVFSDAGPPSDDGGTATLRLLFLGNSYTAFHGLAEQVRQVLGSVGVAAEVHSVHPGGRRLAQHAADLGVASSAVAMAFEQRWDRVILQDQSQIPGFPEGSADRIASDAAAQPLAQAALDAGARVVFYQTWGRRDGDERNPGLYPDFSTMQDRLTEGYARLASLAAMSGAEVAIGAVGEAFRRVHDAGDRSHFEALYDADGSHPSVQGTYLAALVLAKASAGIRPEDVSFAPEGMSAEVGARLREVAAAD